MDRPCSCGVRRRRTEQPTTRPNHPPEKTRRRRAVRGRMAVVSVGAAAERRLFGGGELVTMAETFPSVWYATPATAASLTKLVVFDHSGSVGVSPQAGGFSGRRGRLDLSRARVVSLTRQRPLWATFALMNAVL